MALTFAQIGENRLEKVLINDKKQNPKQIIKILNSDIYTLLSNYMEVRDIDINFDIIDDIYYFNITTSTKRLKNIGILPE